MDGFYVSAVKQPVPKPKATALLMGPFLTHDEALEEVDRVRTFALTKLADPDASFALYGTLRMRPKRGQQLPPGKFNQRLGFTPDERFGIVPTPSPSDSPGGSPSGATP